MSGIQGRRDGRPRGRAEGRLRREAAALLLCLALPFLTAFTGPRGPGLLPGIGPDDQPLTVADLDRLRAQPAPPAITGRAALVWDTSNNVELYAKAPDERLAPGSTAKMLTAILTLELLPLDTRVTIERRDLAEPDESKMDLAVGDVLTVEDLLYGMLLVSGGDAARACARVAGMALLAGAPGDPVARFMQEIDARTARLRLPNTHFVNPHGDDMAGQYSSARDLLRIANEGLRNPVFARVVETRETTRRTVDGRRSFAMTNSNALLGARPGIHGVKTGTTPQAGRCLVTAQWGPGGRILTVVLGSDGTPEDDHRYTDTAALLDWTNAAFRWAPLGKDGGPPGLRAALTSWGVEFRETRTAVVQAWEAPTLRYRLLLDPGATGPERGQAIFLTGTRELFALPVYTAARTSPGATPATPPQR